MWDDIIKISKKQHESIMKTQTAILKMQNCVTISLRSPLEKRDAFQWLWCDETVYFSRKGGNKMKKFRRLAAAAIVGTMTVSMLTACGGGGAETETEDGKTIVRFSVGGSAAELEQYEKAVDAFNEQSETVQVEMTGLPGDNYNEKIMTSLNSKTAPDCFYSEEATFGELEKSGMLLDLTEYLESEDSALKTADVPESILMNFMYEEGIYGVPVDCNPMVIYYNKDLIESLGLQSPQELYDAGEWNFAALQEMAEALRDSGNVGFVYENYWAPLYSVLSSDPDTLYSEDMTTAYFDSERVTEGLTWLNDNIQSDAFTYAGTLESGESADTLFVSGKAGMLYAGRWFVADFTDLSFTYDVVPFPYYQTTDEVLSAMPSSPMVINKNTENPEAVWEFISFYCGEEGQRIRMEGQGNAVPTIAGLEDIVLTGEPEHAQYFLDAVDISFTYASAEATHPGLTDALNEEVEKMLVGEQDVATTQANMQTVATEMLAEE